MTLKLTLDEMKLLLFHIKPYVQQDPEKLENKDAIWVYILKEIAKKILNKMADDPIKKIYSLPLKTYQVRAFKEILDQIDFIEIGNNDPWQYAVLVQLYNQFPDKQLLIESNYFYKP
jgi:signal transduction protein with GAF and PtsI domain